MDIRRFLWIDYAKFFAILCVVLIHTALPAEAKKLFRIFIIPLFFFLAGMFSRQHANYSVFLKKVGLRILIPYLTFNVVTYLFWLFLGRNFGDDAGNTTAFWQPLPGIIYGSGHSLIHYVPLWFLPCFFMTENIYFLLQKYSKSLNIKIALIVTCGILGWLNYHFNPYLLPWGLGSALVMLVFYGLGDIVGKKVLQRPIISFKNNALLLLTSVIAMLFVYCWLPINEEISVIDNKYGNYILFFIGAPVGITGIIAFCKWLENVCIPIKPLLFIGQNTLIVFGLHLMAMSFIKAVTSFIFKLPLSIFDQTLGAIALAIGAVIICVPFIFIINKYFPWFIGKNKK